MKTCTCCKDEKVVSDFRKRKCKGSFFVMGKCRDCEKKERANKYWENPEKYRAISKVRALKYHHKNRKQILVKLKVYRESEQGKNVRSNYVKNNLIRIKGMHQVCAKRWAKKNISALTDQYVISNIKQRSTLTKEQILQHPELINAWKINTKIKRLCKTLKH